LKINTNMGNSNLYLGLTGLMASGKGEMVNVLLKNGFVYISLSDIVREEVKKLGIEPSRAKMQDIGNSIRQHEGPGALGKRVREKIQLSSQKRWVIDGIRNPSEVSELRKLSAFFLLGIQCDIETILQRLKSRGRNMDTADDLELRQRLERELGAGEPSHGQQVGRCLEISDFLIKNNDTLEVLAVKTKHIIDQLERKI